MIYVVLVDGREIVRTDWSPLAQAAWHRATHDQDAGGFVELLRDGHRIASARVTSGHGQPWPDGKACDLRDISRALFLLLRDDEWDLKEIAAAMTDFGLPTSRSRLEAMRGAAGRSAVVAEAEIVTLLYSVLRRYKQDRGES